jgi:hypothetical protein
MNLINDSLTEQALMAIQKKKFGKKTCETKEWFCFVISITGLSRPNTGKDDDDFLLYKQELVLQDPFQGSKMVW